MRHAFLVPPVETVRKDHRLGSRALIGSVVSDLQRLVALEVALARQELKELAARNAVAAGLMAFGGLLVMLGILVAAPALTVVLVPWHWQAAAVWVGASAWCSSRSARTGCASHYHLEPSRR
jgi:hypothetical protein